MLGLDWAGEGEGISHIAASLLALQVCLRGGGNDAMATAVIHGDLQPARKDAGDFQHLVVAALAVAVAVQGDGDDKPRWVVYASQGFAQ